MGFDKVTRMTSPFGAPDCTVGEVSCANADVLRTATATSSRAIRTTYFTSALYSESSTHSKITVENRRYHSQSSSE